MNKISVVIITYNEEKNISRCLASVTPIADEVVVVDSFSTDKTREICENYGARFIQHKFDGHIQQKNWARQQAKHNLVLSLDADEALSGKLQHEIANIKTQNHFDGYSFNRLTNYCGKWIKHTGWYPDKKLRLWDKNKGEWGGKNPHDVFIMNSSATIQHINADILHYSYHTMQQHLRQIVQFSEIAARARFEKGSNIPLLLLLLRPFFMFIKKYILKLGLLDGYYGFVISVLTAYGTFQKDILLREWNKNKNKKKP